jgi:hypothetical protein
LNTHVQAAKRAKWLVEPGAIVRRRFGAAAQSKISLGLDFRPSRFCLAL